jgi:hypothetical protein
MLYGLLCSLGIKGGLIIGTTAAELLTSYWHSRNHPSPPLKVYLFNRRIHHGEIGALLGLSALFLRGTSNPTTSAAAIFTGIGIGLVKDDYLDIMNWFRFTKKNVDQKQTSLPTTKQETGQVRPTVTEAHDTCKISEEKCSAIAIAEITSTNHLSKKAILDPLKKCVRNLIEAQSQTLRQIELQIKETQKHFLSD